MLSLIIFFLPHVQSLFPHINSRITSSVIFPLPKKQTNNTLHGGFRTKCRKCLNNFFSTNVLQDSLHKSLSLREIKPYVTFLFVKGRICVSK